MTKVRFLKPDGSLEREIDALHGRLALVGRGVEPGLSAAVPGVDAADRVPLALIGLAPTISSPVAEG